MAEYEYRQKRRTFWTADEELSLLKLWEKKLPKFRAKRTARFYGEIACEMRDRGYRTSVSEIQVKIHNIKSRYRLEKKKLSTSGEATSSWRIYDRVHRILDKLYSYNTENANEKSSDVINNSIEETQLVDSEASRHSLTPESTPNGINKFCYDSSSNASLSDEPQPQRKTKKTDSSQKDLLQELKASNKMLLQEMKLMRETDQQALQLQKELVKIERRRNDILENFLKIYKERI